MHNNADKVIIEVWMENC